MAIIVNKKKIRKKNELPKKKNKLSSRGLFYFSFIFFILTVAWTLFFSDLLDITKMEIVGLDKLEDASIREQVKNELTGKYFNLIKKNNLILFPEKKINKELQEKFKRIRKIAIKKKFAHEIIIEIDEINFKMLLCNLEQCVVLDEKGSAYMANNFSQEELMEDNLITVIDSSNAQINSESNPLEADFQEFILQLNDYITGETEIKLKNQYETPSKMSGDLKVETEEGWKIYFSESVGIEKEILMLKMILEHKIEKEQQKDLEYIDLRIPNKVFYKFKEGTEQAEQAEEIKNVSTPEVKKEEEKKKKK